MRDLVLGANIMHQSFSYRCGFWALEALGIYLLVEVERIENARAKLERPCFIKGELLPTGPELLCSTATLGEIDVNLEMENQKMPL
jgi:hypothetical protein